MRLGLPYTLTHTHTNTGLPYTHRTPAHTRLPRSCPLGMVLKESFVPAAELELGKGRRERKGRGRERESD